MLAARLDAASGGAQAPLQLDGGGGAYDMTFSIGTPPQTLSALADTGSDLIWAKCGPCTQCAPQGSPSFYPNTSSSFSKLPCSSSGLCGNLMSQSLATCGAGGAECDYRYSYGLAADSHHYTQGYLASEIFTLGGDAVSGIGFGCTNMSEGGYGTGSGLVGLGRGPLSLVSQLNVGAFSYCLTSDASKTSPLLFGSGDLTGAGVQSTPLLQSSTFYTVKLNSISIGSVKTSGTGSGGIIFDSGTTVTFLAEPAYSLAKAAVLLQTTNLTRVPGRDGYEVCFQTAGAVFPTMVLHFDGGGDMAPPTENYFGPVDNSVSCWIVQKSPSLSIVGNILQMNFHIRYDVGNSVLSFQPADCNSL
ncbi:Aspartic proteinase nepenthesin-1 [Dichanthelium oligosanthes]|uniref:Aspartic proteinase nepenthesin-1 n=1 Tax=Dichanthelium oligosanthes TaxID=888268 RepID=A0A1E5UKM7_9POAL|nr:Aspartic proteinase nepenthesin-1 [Dichanthelium oligosanthes]